MFTEQPTMNSLFSQLGLGSSDEEIAQVPKAAPFSLPSLPLRLPSPEERTFGSLPPMPMQSSPSPSPASSSFVGRRKFAQFVFIK